MLLFRIHGFWRFHCGSLIFNTCVNVLEVIHLPHLHLPHKGQPSPIKDILLRGQIVPLSELPECQGHECTSKPYRVIISLDQPPPTCLLLIYPGAMLQLQPEPWVCLSCIIAVPVPSCPDLVTGFPGETPDWQSCLIPCPLDWHWIYAVTLFLSNLLLFPPSRTPWMRLITLTLPLSLPCSHPVVLCLGWWPPVATLSMQLICTVG